MLESLTRQLPAEFENLFSTFMPGPLTLIISKEARVPDVVTAGRKYRRGSLSGASGGTTIDRGERVANGGTKREPLSARESLEEGLPFARLSPLLLQRSSRLPRTSTPLARSIQFA